jgi:hypothetical protein
MFNYIATEISTRDDGRLFSRFDTSQVNWNRAFCFSIEGPQSPGRFLGENEFQAVVFRERCDEAYQRLMERNTERWHSQLSSLLLRLIIRPSGIIRKKEKLKGYYQVLTSSPADPFWRKSNRSPPERERYD